MTTPISKEQAIEALLAAINESDQQWTRMTENRLGGAEREAGRGGGLRAAVEIIKSPAALPVFRDLNIS